MNPPASVIGREDISGYRTVKLSRGNETYWYALDYGCAMVRSRSDLGAEGISENRLVALIPGDPDQSLFATEQLQEVAPSAAMRQQNPANCTAECQASRDAHIQQLDAEYNANRPH
jgi:hypothetical protein